MVTTHILGYPRIGRRRELKFALERFWAGSIPESALHEVGYVLRGENWTRQEEAGLGLLTAGDFSFYDHVLDHAVLLGCIPARFGFDAGRLDLARYFALARGDDRHAPLELTKWFDTNYHYLVPELERDTSFEGAPERYLGMIDACRQRNRPTKAVLLGPVTFLWLAKCAGEPFDRLRLLATLVHAYARILGQLQARGVEWVQIDEPILALELAPQWLAAFGQAYATLAEHAPRLLLTTYFGGVEHNLDTIVRLPVHGIHLDLVRAPDQLEAWRNALPSGWVLSAGIVDGRNVWRTDLRAAAARLRPLHAALGERLWIAPSCSLLHVPLTLAGDEGIDPEVRPWLAFAEEKLGELSLLARLLDRGETAVRDELAQADAALAARRTSPRVVDAQVRSRAARITPDMLERRSPFAQRIRAQRRRLRLPAFPTTTIGSFPQTPEIRAARAAHRRGQLDDAAYRAAMRAEIAQAVERQEAIGLDVLVHGEAERNDMVEYFAARLAGFAVSGNGWVQSYGSRCVKPPILFGDVSRSAALTLDETLYAQSLTARPMKGMLTGPVTLLQWSFVRDDQPREATAMQLALAIRDEVAALEHAGIRIVQIDEPAFREGLPLKRSEWKPYLDWAVRAFRLAHAVVADETQIHTHMCYSEFGDILDAIAAMDADVVTIEASRSRMDLLDAFGAQGYPNDIGPGVYDIHSPRVPSADEMVALLSRAAEVIAPQQLWVNPDCGLKTRSWREVEPALRNLVAAAKRMRESYGAAAAPGKTDTNLTAPDRAAAAHSSPPTPSSEPSPRRRTSARAGGR